MNSRYNCLAQRSHVVSFIIKPSNADIMPSSILQLDVVDSCTFYHTPSLGTRGLRSEVRFKIRGLADLSTTAVTSRCTNISSHPHTTKSFSLKLTSLATRTSSTSWLRIFRRRASASALACWALILTQLSALHSFHDPYRP